MNELKELAEEIRRLREAKGYSQADLVRRTKLSHSVVYRAEIGDSLPSRGTLVGMAEGLEIEPSRLLDLADRVRVRQEQLWLGLPHVIWAAPLISLIFKFSGPFQLMGCHFGKVQNGGELVPVPQSAGMRGQEKFNLDVHQPLDGVTLMEGLISGRLDCAWLPRATYLAHQGSLNRYASLSVQAPPSNHLLLRRARVSVKPPETLSEFWSVGRTVCFLAGDTGEHEYEMILPPAASKPQPRRASSFKELLDDVAHALESDKFVLCFLNEPLTSLIKQRADSLGADWFALRRETQDYTLDSLLHWRGINFDFVSHDDLDVAAAWIKSYLRTLQGYVDFSNSGQALERTASCLDIDLRTVRATLGETDVRSELWLDPQILSLFPT